MAVSATLWVPTFLLLVIVTWWRGSFAVERAAVSEGKKDDEVLEEQLAYYQARAGEYDEWFLRRGRYDRGVEATRQWFSEVNTVEARLEQLGALGSCLELAAGTGLWTDKLVRRADALTVVDGSAEMLAACRQRVGEGTAISYVEADLFTWKSGEQFDTVFFSFWLSHVPPERFGPFWQMVKGALRPGGRVFFLDSLHVETSTAADHVLPGREEITLERKLNDGRRYRIYKVYHDPPTLEEGMREQGFDLEVETTGTYFYTGIGRRLD